MNCFHFFVFVLILSETGLLISSSSQGSDEQLRREVFLPRSSSSVFATYQAPSSSPFLLLLLFSAYFMRVNLDSKEVVIQVLEQPIRESLLVQAQGQIGIV